LLELWNRAKEGEHLAPEAFRTLVYNTPFINLFYYPPGARLPIPVVDPGGVEPPLPAPLRKAGAETIAAARLCRRIEACGSGGEVEVYPGVDHGFAFARRATYHQAAERHWARFLDLFNRALAPHGDDRRRQALDASRARRRYR
jgi:hypothetical protein